MFGFRVAATNLPQHVVAAPVAPAAHIPVAPVNTLEPVAEVKTEVEPAGNVKYNIGLVLSLIGLLNNINYKTFNHCSLLHSSSTTGNHPNGRLFASSICITLWI